MEIAISPQKVSRFLLITVSLLVLAHIIQISFYLFGDFDYIRYLDLDIEANLPTFYSSIAIELCALLLFGVFLCEQQRKSKDRWRWLGLSLVFVFLGLDEGTKVHEEIGDLMENIVNATGLLHFPWVIPYGVALLLLVAFYSPWLFRLPKKTRIEFITAGIVFVIGAIGFEVLSARENELYGANSISYTLYYTIEELCEMLGIVLFVEAILNHMGRAFGEITLKFNPKRIA